MRSAVLDVGSNSILLVVAERQNDSWVPLLETSAVTGLGTDVKTTGLLRKDRMEDSLKAISKAFDAAKSLGAECRAYGTMALRIANNSDEFLTRAESQGTPVRVISGEQEATLGVASVARDEKFRHLSRISVIDPGGHSTELSTADIVDGKVKFIASKSIPVGTLGLISHCHWPECPGPDELFKATVYVDDAVAKFENVDDRGTVVALGATPSVLVTVRDQHAKWEAIHVHGKSLTYEEVGRAVGRFSSMPVRERASLVGMEPGREGTIHAGALILERFLNFLRAENCLVSCRGWRFALLDGEI